MRRDRATALGDRVRQKNKKNVLFFIYLKKKKKKKRKDTMDFGDSGERMGRVWGIKDYKLGSEYTDQVMGPAKSHKSSLTYVTKYHLFPKKPMEIKNLNKNNI